MQFKRLASVVTLVASLCLVISGVNVASAAPSTLSATSLRVTAAADMSTMTDCFVYNGSRRGCTYYKPTYEPYTAQFRVCDYADPGGIRYTKGRISVINRKAHGDGFLEIQLGQAWDSCSNWEPVPLYPGDRVCIHTGVEGLGWTTAECRTF